MSASCRGAAAGEQATQSGAADAQSGPGGVKWRVRPMRQEDVEKCLAIWLQVELTEARQTVASALATDPGGFYVAELEGTGEVIGMCAGTLTREDTAFMGFYAVEPNFQGIGVGRELWAQTLKRLDDATMNVGLYGVPAMSAKYKKSGFKVEDAVRMLIYESQPGQQLQLDQLVDFGALQRTFSGRPVDDSTELELRVIDSNTSEQLLERLIEYDARVNRFSRQKLLKHYLANGTDTPLTLALVRQTSLGGVNQLKEAASSGAARSDEGAAGCDDQSSAEARLSRQMSGALSLNRADENQLEVLGYGCVRADNTDGGMIGPIYAQSTPICELLLRSLIERFPLPATGKFSAMSLTSNSAAGALLERVGLREMDQCSRMFTKFVPAASADQIFYVHSPNFTLF